MSDIFMGLNEKNKQRNLKKEIFWVHENAYVHWIFKSVNKNEM